MNCWEHLDRLKTEAEDLATKLSAMGWTLLPASPAGEYRAKKRGSYVGSGWREVRARNAEDVLAAASAEVKRQEELKAAQAQTMRR